MALIGRKFASGNVVVELGVGVEWLPWLSDLQDVTWAAGGSCCNGLLHLGDEGCLRWGPLEGG